MNKLLSKRNRTNRIESSLPLYFWFMVFGFAGHIAAGIVLRGEMQSFHWLLVLTSALSGALIAWFWSRRRADSS